MGQIPSQYDDGDEEFHQLISRYNFNELKLIYEYIHNDLICIVESIDTKELLEYLASKNILNKELYLQMKRDLGPFVFSERLVQDILEAGNEAIVGLWEGIYHLQFWCSSSFYMLRDELNNYGDSLMQQILLDRNGHPLTSELKNIQEYHRQHLLEKAMLRPSESSGHNKDVYGSDHYMHMITSQVRPFHRSSEHKLIETAIKHENHLQNLHGSVLPDKLFRWCNRLKCVPQAVMVIGVPGIGKTTLLEMLVVDWANRKFYQRFSFIFFFRFRDLNRVEKISLESMILQEYPYLKDQLESILRDPERLLFIFDGLDESVHEIDFKSSRLSRDVHQEENVGAVVVGLARQSLLKGCSLIVTSQPDRLAGKNISVFKRVQEIIGFLPKERQLFIERFFMDKELSDKALSFMKENSVLYTFCYNPSYCWIVCTVLSVCFRDQPTNDDQMSSTPKTLTQLFAAFIADFLSSHSLDKISSRSLLTAIGWMAEHGVMNHVTKFKNQTLSQFNVDRNSELLLGLMKRSTSFSETFFSFRHPIIQEFLAAVGHFIDYSPERLHRSLEQAKSCKDNRGELFLSFLCGLSDISTRAILESYLGDLSSDAAKDVLTWLQEELTNLDDFKDDKRRSLNVFFKFFELQNKDFALECLGSLRKLNFYGAQVTSLDCSVLHFILQSCRETEFLCLSNCRVKSEDIKRLAPGLHTIHDLRFCDNYFGDDGVKFICSALKHPECKIETLWLSATGLTDIACSYLGSAISNNNSLRTLFLSYNNLVGPHFGDLVKALSSPPCKLEVLYLNSTRLTDNSCSLLASGIGRNQSLKTLSLSSNDLTGPHLGDLMEALSSPTCTVEQLMMQDVLLQDEHLPLLIPLSNNKNLTDLELSNNSLTSGAMAHLRELILQIPSLKNINLYFNHRLSFDDRKSLLALRAQKPGLHIGID